MLPAATPINPTEEVRVDDNEEEGDREVYLLPYEKAGGGVCG